MATRLATFATAVHARLASAGVTIPQQNDVISLQKHAERLRIVWLTPGGTIEPPRQAGGRIGPNDPANRVRLCKLRVEECQAWIFGETREAAEDLLDAVIAAIYAEAQHIEMPRYRWPNELRDEAGNVLRAQVCVLTFFLRLPVADEIAPLVTITGVDHECELTG